MVPLAPMVPSPLRLARLRRGWSQAAIADAIGVTQATVSLVELGQRLAGPTFLSLVRLYNLDAEALRRRMLVWRRSTHLREPVGKARAA